MLTISESERYLWGSTLFQLFTYSALLLEVLFVCLIEMRSCYVAQVGPELLLTCLCLLSAKMMGTGYHTWLRSNLVSVRISVTPEVP